jgi:hypothetical protein
MDIKSTVRVIILVMVLIGVIWVVEIVTAYENLMWLRMFSKVYLGLKLYWLIFLILIHYHLQESTKGSFHEGIKLWSQGRLTEMDIWATMNPDEEQQPLNGQSHS